MKRLVLGFGQKLLSGIFSGGSKYGNEAVVALEQAGVQMTKNGAPIAGESAQRILSGVGKDTFLGKIFKWGAIGGAAEALINGKNGLVGGAASKIWTSLGQIEAEQNVVGRFHGFFKMLQEILGAFGYQSAWVDENLTKSHYKDNMFSQLINDPAAFASDHPIMAAGAGLGTAVAGYKGVKALTSSVTGIPNVARAGFEVAEVGLLGRTGNALKSFGSKIPVVGKYLAIGGTAIGVGMAGLGAMTGDAHAADGVDGSIRTDNTLQSAGADVGAVGMSIVGTNSAIQITQSLAPALTSNLAKGTALMGLKVWPGIASVVAAGEALYGTTKYALNGEWEKAGTRLVAGVGETIAGVGGIITYGTLGTAWREAVRAGGAAIFGEDKAIDHSYVYQAGEGLVNMFKGATTPTEEQQPREYAATSAPAWVPAAL